MAGVLGEEFDDNLGTDGDLHAHWKKSGFEPDHELSMYIAGG